MTGTPQADSGGAFMVVTREHGLYVTGWPGKNEAGGPAALDRARANGWDATLYVLRPAPGDHVATATGGVYCDGDECIRAMPEGLAPTGWTFSVSEGRVSVLCAECAAWAREEAS